MSIRFSLAGILNAIALAFIFPVTIATVTSIKFWVVVALLSAAVTSAEYKGAERAKKGEL